MPYVEGESLRERLDREHQLPVDEGVQIAKNVAEALDYAHKRGVIHRDIKPANILLQSGKPVISDFGIALAVGAAGGGRLTETGLSLGTPHYMSPEQATGDLHVGPATDVYALGCVLYEMLVGEPPYTGGTPQAILGRIITEAPPRVVKQRKSVPDNVEAVIANALEKVPADRFRTAADFARALDDAGFRHGRGATAGVPGRGSWNALTITFAGMAAVLALTLGMTLTRVPAASVSASTERFSLEIEPNTSLEMLPDGSGVAYVSEGQVMLRRWDSLDPMPISGADGARVGVILAVSPTGSEIAYIDRDEQLKVIPIQGGVSRTLASPAFCCVTWPSDGHIYYSPPVERNIRRVPAVGGLSEDVTQRAAGEANQGFMQLLPDGEWGLISTTVPPYQIESVRLSTGERTLVTEGTRPFLTATGHLVWVSSQGQLVGAAFDVDQRVLTGPTVPLIERIASRGLIPRVSLSRTGVLVYTEGGGRAEQRLVVMDLDGDEDLLALGARPIIDVSWLPDGESVIYSSDGQIFVYDVLLNTTPRQVTFEGVNRGPVVAPDGSSVVFTSTRAGRNSPDLWLKNLGDDSPPTPLLPDVDTETAETVTDWPSDSLIAMEMAGDLWTVDLSEPDRPRVGLYLSSEARLSNLVISPDGTMAAYISDETGRAEIYVRSFPDPGAATRVSGEGGDLPFWSPDGDVLYYRNSEGGAMSAARIQNGPILVVGSVEEVLASTPVNRPDNEYRTFSPLHPNGDRLILARDVDASSGDTSAEIRVILVQNFFEELKRRVPN
jgi:serine/threonine-protein kinase